MSQDHASPRRVERLRVLFLAPPVAGFLFILVSGWPVCLNPDIANTIRDGLNFKFLGYQAPMFGFIWAAVLAVLPLKIAIQTFYVTQVFAYWLVIALLMWTALRMESVTLAMVALVASVTPPLIGTVVLVESNMQAGMAWALAVLIGVVRPGRRSLMVGVLLVLYGYLVRSGMDAAAVPMLFAIAVINQPTLTHVRAGLWSVAGVAGFALLAFSVTYFMLGAPSRGVIVGISELFDVAGVYQRTRTHCIPSSMYHPSRSAQDILRDYDPTFVNPILYGQDGGFAEPTAPGQQVALHACWVDTIRRHPREFLQVKLRFAAMFMNIGSERPMRIALSCEPANPDFGLALPQNAAWAAVRRYVLASADHPVWRAWIWFSVTSLVVGLAVAWKVAYGRAALAVLLGATGTLVPHLLLGQGVVARYVFLPYILCLTATVLVGGPVIKAVVSRLARRS